ncbi:tRNA-dihydrouridine(20/20a) synthase [Leptospira kobayashii]|uniref:tRNA-dihydrouridine(20/20a) synthase n=1 Tax=Leptospira kobayashii TaxID=1917830 RepID=A0ABN6KE20_9LEPT|nr:tRNA dihydrouridine(20/20a) synthase DusA [Leptospira kobayashii]BDA77939.1 tRNA-dihydrouridine(20/20a) synthase [Leptospira kobayashii]
MTPNHRLSVAPMMDWTDRHYRYFMRLITKKTLLYTEMVTTGAILRGKNRDRYLKFSQEEFPLALQLGGDDPNDLAECAKIGEDYGYSEINLNVGCPSDRVQNGSFGACLMKEPDKVARLVSAMKSSTRLPITVKHRIGVNGKESLEDLLYFVRSIRSAGVDRIIIHARIAILEGLSPAENRTIPPLRYNDVYAVKDEFPDLSVSINGGIKSLEETSKELSRVDGVMIGRAAYENPFLFANADSLLWDTPSPGFSRLEILQRLKDYLQEMGKEKIRPHSILRHTLGLYHGNPGARFYRRFLSENMHKPNTNYTIIDELIGKAKEHQSQIL